MTQKDKKEIQYENIKRVAANPEVLTKNNQRVDEVLRIFARMISKAILKEREEERLKESENANSERKPIPNSNQNSSSIKISPHTVKPEDLPPDRLGFTRKEVAKLLGVGISTVYKAIENKQLRSVEFGGRVVIPKIALLEFLHNTGDKEDPQKG